MQRLQASEDRGGVADARGMAVVDDHEENGHIHYVIMTQYDYYVILL